MSIFSSLSDSDQDRIKRYVDHLHRPTTLVTAQNLNQWEIALNQLLASPSGQPSSIVSTSVGPPPSIEGPASDSILGMLNSIQPGEIIPILDTGLDSALPVMKDIIIQNIIDIYSILQSHNTASARQAYALIAGGINISR